jgi:GntR family transcriptional regulator
MSSRIIGVVAMNVKFNNRDPVYVQVIRHFKEQIATGHFEPGQEIPSRRELANQLKINPNTAQRAYKEMEEQGLIFTERNLPSRITKDEVVIKLVREELILEAVHSFIASVQSINVPLNEVLDLVKVNYERYQHEQEGNS